MAERSMVPIAGSEPTKRLGATLIGLVLDDELNEFAAVLRTRTRTMSQRSTEYVPPCPPASSPTIDHLRFGSR